MVSIPTTQEPWWIELCKVSVDLSGVTSILCQFLLQDLQFQRFFDPQDELHMYVKCMLLQKTFTV